MTIQPQNQHQMKKALFNDIPIDVSDKGIIHYLHSHVGLL